MSAPAYGTLYRGRVVRPDVVADNYLVMIAGAAPGRVIGPIQSAVRNLVPDDAVLIASVGTTQNDYVIVGRLPAFEPPALEIDDIVGLQAALDDRVTDAEFTAFQGANTTALNALAAVNTTQNGRLDGIEALNTTQNGRLTAAEGVNTTQDGRLTSAEGRLTADEALITANGVAITALDSNAWFNNQHPVDSYGDQFSSFLRELCLNKRTLTSNGTFVFRTRARRALSVSLLRVMVVTLGTGAGSTTGFLYKGAAQHGSYTLAASGASSLASLNEQAIAIGATPIAAGDWLIFGVRAAGYTVFPQIATMLNAVQGNVANPTVARAAYLTRTTSGAMPATIDTSDGSWTFTDATPTWLGLA